MSCVVLVFLELFLLTSAGPGWFHQERRPPNQGSHGSGPASPSWGAWGSSWDYQQMIHTQNGYLAYDGGATEHYRPQGYNPTPRPTTKQTPTGVIYGPNAAIGGAAIGGNNAIVTSEASVVMSDDRRNVAKEEIRPVISDASAASIVEANQSDNQKHTGGNIAIVVSEASLNTGDDRLNVAKEEIRPIINDASAAFISEANQSDNQKHTGGNNAIVASVATLVMDDNRRNVAKEEIRPAISDANAASIGEANHQVPQNNNNEENKDHFQTADQNFNTPERTVTSEPEEEQVFGAAAIGSAPVPRLNDTSAPSFQWHVGVYSKMWTPYMQICGGSVVKTDVILSAAHCFWADEEGQQPATQFAVAGGKLFRPWTSKKDQFAQRSDVSEIILPVRFRGIMTSFQDDIAVVRLSTPFVYAEGLQPVCVDFGVEFERQQVVPGTPGTVAGWGLTEENGRPSQRLNFLELRYVDVGHCVLRSEPSFIKYITSDKICAGDETSGKALCRGDSGGGLVFFSNTTPYLRGIASTAAANENLCNAFAIATFTHIYAHRTFLRDNVPDIDKECARNSDIIDTGTLVGQIPVTGNSGENNTGIPNYVPFLSRVPQSNFYCNCNCKP